MCKCVQCAANFEREPKRKSQKFCSFPCSVKYRTGKHIKENRRRDNSLYAVWIGIRRRCSIGSVSDEMWKRYGGRGISMCHEWEDYTVFEKWALTNGYQPGLEIDRRDNDGDYTPSNCRIVNDKAQARNRSSNTIITAFGESKTAVEWSEDHRCVVAYGTLLVRIRVLELEPETAITLQPRRGGRKTIAGSKKYKQQNHCD